MATGQLITYRCPHCQQPVDVELKPENELLVCPNPNCQKPFKIDVPKAEPVPELLLPPGANGHAAKEVAAPAPVAKPPGEVPEETLRVIHLAMFRRYPFRCAGHFILLFGASFAALVFGLRDYAFLAIV